MSKSTRATKRLSVGDRVIEAPKMNLDHCVQKDHPNFEQIAKIIRNRRVGTVEEIVPRKDSRGHVINYAMILWDELQSPCLHHVMRLRKIDNDASVKNDAA